VSRPDSRMVGGLRVSICQDTFASCFCHAFSTENEEIMGLLIGTVEAGDPLGGQLNGGGGNNAHSQASPSTVVNVLTSMVLIRSDKRKDRVEIPIETMAEVATKVEKLAEEFGIPELRVIGWYHSHPHITALPSHVDLNTQASYQLLDLNFIGLIFSAFDGKKDTHFWSERLCCFQAGPGNSRKLIPFHIKPSHQFKILNRDSSKKAWAITKHAESAIPTIIALNMKEESDAFRQMENRFKALPAESKTIGNFNRRTFNSSTFVTATTQIGMTLGDSVSENSRVNAALRQDRMHALQKYLQFLKRTVPQT